MTMTHPDAALLQSAPRFMIDRYELVAELARGGMGTVFLARLGGAGGFERLFAIKLMHEHLAIEPHFVSMLLDEARTAANIHHPNAVGIIDARESAVGYYLVMNYVDGFPLSDLLERDELDRKKRVSVAARMIADAAHGLHAAHTARNAQGQALGIVHRDVSPQNVLVGTDGVGRIVDFGIALAASRSSSSRPGFLKGKPSYMAPEQARGEACDPRTDIFGLGVMLWEALTGRELFTADTDLATLQKAAECVVEHPGKYAPVPEALSAVVMCALAKDPRERFPSARDFARALERTAEAAGLLANAHEVEEVVGSLFAESIAQRQSAISHLLSQATGPLYEVDRVGLASVPQLLGPRHPTASGEGFPSGWTAPPLTYPPSGANSGVRASRAGVPLGGQVGTFEMEGRPARKRRRLRAVLGAAAVLGLLLAVTWMWQSREADHASMQPVASAPDPADVPPPPAVALPPAIEPRAVEPQAVVPIVQWRSIDDPSSPEVTPQPRRSATHPSSAARRTRADRPGRERLSAPPTEANTSASAHEAAADAPDGPLVEANPYLTR